MGVRSQALVRVSLFITCYNDTLFPATGRAVVRLLERLGHTIDFPFEQTCCGQMHYNTGYQQEAMPLMRRFVEIFADSEAVCIPSSSCVAMIRDHYPKMAAEESDPGLVEEHRRRGDDDFVAKEIDLAFQAGARLTVIPVFVDNAEPPEPSHLLPTSDHCLLAMGSGCVRRTCSMTSLTSSSDSRKFVIPRRRCATYPKADHGKSRLRSRSTRTRRRPPSARRRRHPTRIIIGWSSKKRPRTWWFSSEQG